MINIVKERIEQVKSGEIPDGYTWKWHLMPITWEDVSLSKIFSLNARKNKGNEYSTVFTNSAEYGIIPQSEYFDKEIANRENTEGYYVVHPGDYVYNPRISELAPYGPFKRNDTGITGIVSPLYTVLIPTKKYQDSEFLRYYLESNQWYKYAYSIANYGARFDRMNISNQDLMELPIAMPPIAEQKKIAEILVQCDKVIGLKEKLLEEEKRKKDWLIENILTGKIRLNKFSDSWEETSIGKCVEYLVGYPFTSESFTCDGIRLLRCSNVKRGYLSWEASLTMYWKEDDSLKPFLMKPGDIVIAMDGALIGRSFAMVEESDTPSYLVQRVARIRSKINNLIFRWINSDKFARHIDTRKTSTAIPHMTIKDILSFKISIPKSISEVTMIGDILQNQDKIIRSLTEEISAHKHRKKALMQLLLTGIVRVKP